MGRILYFDCLSGISGDMTIGALLDLGADQVQFREQLSGLAVDGYQLEIVKKRFSGISGTDFDVVLSNDSGHQKHRNLNDINQLIEASSIGSETKKLSQQIFHCIAQAEATVHGRPIDEIHFHEVGAIDSIVDIVGTAICLSLLKIDKVVSSPLHLGTGFIKSAHGKIPVPAPATIEILRGVPVYSTGVKGELVTPTGAAIIKTLAEDFVSLPPMTIESIGYGTGKKEYEIPNALRIIMGTIDQTSGVREQQLVMLETNIDDMNPESYSYIVPKLFEAGALDVYLTHVMMKKGRPGVVLHVLCQPEQYPVFENIIFQETTTLGIRKSTVDRHCLERKQVPLDTQFGQIQIKVAYKDGKLLKAAPEYEDCKRIAETHDLPLKDVYQLLSQEIAAAEL
jgi:pyridinium-3,5-bisthiocarboxylic acid mononucleotide nickel chelatase